MKKLSVILSFAFIFTASIFTSEAREVDNSSNKTAQHNITVSIPSYALVGLSSTSAITLEPSAPTTAGESLDFTASSASDNSLWLNYSSIVSAAGNTNTISVEMTDDNLPKGVAIKVLAGNDAGKGKGTTGTAESEALRLSAKSQEFITGIGNCYTGAGSNAGHQLTYTLTLDDDTYYEVLTSGNYSSTVVYTITEN